MVSTAPRSGEADRLPGASGRAERAPAAIPAILILLLAGVALRLVLAYVLLPGSGFRTDVGSFTAWALDLAAHGPGPFYAQAGFADYPPGYLYVLWSVGLVGNLLAGLTGGDAAGAVGALLKVPPILIDGGVAYLLYRVVRGWRGERRDAERLALIAAALYLFNPVTWYDSAIWGQVDAFGALLMLGSILLLIDGQPELATGVGAVAGLVKPQYGVVLAPILGVIILRRHLVKIGSGPRPGRVPAALRGWFVEAQGPRRLVASALVGVAVLIVLSAPFSLSLIGLFVRLAGTAGGYPFLSVNAYNPWALIGSAGNPSLAAGGGWSPDVAGTNPYGATFTAAQVDLLLGLPGVVIGTVLLAAGFLVGAIQLALRDDRRSILLAAVYLSLAFFILPTRVHERYLFPVFALLPLLAVRDRGFTVATLALAAASFVNLHGILTVPLYATPNVVGLPFGAAFRSFGWVALSAAVQTAVFAYALWRLRPAVDLAVAPLRSRLGRAARAPESDPFDLPAPVTPPSLAGPDAGSMPLAALIERRAEPGSDGVRKRLGAWWSDQLSRRSLRRDRSGELDREPVGHPDRLDVAIIGLLLVAGLTLRSWRVEQPYGMYFDEVYHARTATEFLQDWRYGMPHAIYEFTHPHLAKYLIAVGLVAFGDDKVTSQANLGVPVTDALVEPRWSPSSQPAQRDGDRLYVATGTQVEVYDLQTRARLGALAPPGGVGAVHLALDPNAHTLFIADRAGGVWSLSTGALDALRQAGGAAPASLPAPTAVGVLGSPPTTMAVSADGTDLLAALPGGRLVSLAVSGGSVAGRATDPGAAALLSLPASRIVADPSQVRDPSTMGSRLAAIVGGDAAALAARVRGVSGPVDLATPFDAAKLQAVQNAIAAGQLPGVSVVPGAVVAVADARGLTIRDAATLSDVGSIPIAAGATGLALDQSLDTPTLYVAAGRTLEQITVPPEGPATDAGGMTMPGVVRDVRWDAASNLIHVLGRTPNGKADTVYVVEPHGNAVFADARLPFATTAWAMDVQQPYPSTDRQQLIALDAAGQLATVDVGSHAFGWRFVGVILGALTLALIYLLARFLFRRRGVALIAAFLVLADGMFFANSRIAMNDVYVNFFIVAAYTLFAALALGHWRGRSAVLLGLPLLGILVGLACASKWVGFYALGGLVLLVFLRSAVGRWIALGGMVALTGLLGWLAIESPDAQAPFGDAFFLILMVVLTMIVAAAMILRPLRWSLDEVRFAVVAPAVLGVLVAGVGLALGARTLVLAAAVLVALGLGIAGAMRVAARRGLGPLAPPGPEAPGIEPPGEPPGESWLRPGAGLGIPWVWGLLCLTVLPIVVYVISYTPWVALGNQFWGGFPPGNHGQTLWDLTIQMYNYHNDLRATHPATSPWWAWPFDLKPVWFYQEGFANNTVGIIYDAGNLIAFWLSVPAVIWAAWQGWRRHSLPLLIVVLALLCQWIPWARIDRAAFQYHFFTSLPFSYICLAYLLHELWRGPSPRTWALVRLSAAAAIVAVPILWLAKQPLCWLADVKRVDPGSQGCGTVTESFVLTQRVAVALLVLAIGLVAIAWQVRLMLQERRQVAELEDPEGAGAFGQEPDEGRTEHLLPPGSIWLLLTILFTLIALAVATVRFGDGPVLSAPLGDTGAYLFALVVGVPLAVVAWLITRARDPRRFVVGILGAVGLWFVVFYPDIAGLAIPSGLRNLYSVLPLPTYNYDFQFAVNTDPAPAVTPPLLGAQSLALMLVTALLAAAVMYAAWAWRLSRATADVEAGTDGLDAASG